MDSTTLESLDKEISLSLCLSNPLKNHSKCWLKKRFVIIRSTIMCQLRPNQI